MTKMKMMNRIREAIGEYAHIIVMSHISPDGDGTGASYAFAKYLQSLGKQVYVVHEDSIPMNLSLIKRDMFITYEAFKALDTADYKCVIALDTGERKLLGERLALFDAAKLTINIDHHVTNREYADINLVDREASSVGEIVYDMLSAYEYPMDVDDATAIHISLSSDTGSFKYSNTSAKVMRIAADLIDIGINVDQINTELYQNQPYGKVKLLLSIVDTLKLHESGKVATIYVTQQMIEQAEALAEDVDGAVEFVRNIQGVEVVGLFKELKEGVVKASLRSKHDFDVSAVAATFGGGGHKKAAGYRVETDVHDAILSFLERIKG